MEHCSAKRLGVFPWRACRRRDDRILQIVCPPQTTQSTGQILRGSLRLKCSPRRASWVWWTLHASLAPNVSCIAGDARSIGMARQPVSFRCVIAMDPITCESRLLTSNSGWHRSAAATSRSYADNEVLAPVSMDEQRPWFDQAVDKHLPGSTLGLRTLRRALLKT